jgi:hypothetical protein
MEKLRVYFERKANTLSVWYDDPEKEAASEEAEENLVLVKDRKGKVIGVKRLNYLSEKRHKEGGGVPVEVHTV